MADKEIKSCPCCGEDMARVINDNDFFRVRCDYCGLQTEVNYKDEEGAIDSWNMRSSHWHTGTPTEKGWYVLHYPESKEQPYELAEYDGEYFVAVKPFHTMIVRIDVDTVPYWQKIEED